MRVAVLHNAVPEDAPLEDQDTLVQVRAVAEALAGLGHEPATVSCTLDLAALRDELLRLRPDVVFNLVESLGGADSLGYLPSAVLDALGVPYTGNRTEALFLTTHKLLAKQQLRQAGLPTPAWMESGRMIDEGREGHEGGQEDSGKILRVLHVLRGSSKASGSKAPADMDDEAVLRDVEPAEVRRRLAERAARSGRPSFAEQFVEGREFNLSVLAGPGRP